MTEFFRFPRTPHLVWLGTEQARDDKVLTPEKAAGDTVAMPITALFQQLSELVGDGAPNPGR